MNDRIITINDIDEFITNEEVKGFIYGIMEVIPFKEFSNYDDMMNNVIELANDTETKLSDDELDYIFTILVNKDQYKELDY